MDGNLLGPSGDETLEKPVDDTESSGTPDPVDLKREGIRRACQEHDVKALVEYATSKDGLVDDDLRQLACRLLSTLPRLLVL